MENVYILCLDPLRPRQQAEFEDFLDETEEITNWLNDIPSCYYIVSISDENFLTDLIQDGLAYPRSFLITKVDENFNGLLSKESWRFLKNAKQNENE